MARVAVQLEDTLAPGGENLDEVTIHDPFPGAKEFLAALHAAGHTIVIVSSRRTYSGYGGIILNWLVHHQLWYDDVWCLDGLPQVDFFVTAKSVPVSPADKGTWKRALAEIKKGSE